MLGLTKIRKEKGWTRDELARRSGVATLTIYALEKGRRQGNMATWDKLAAVLGVGLDTLRREARNDDD